MLKKTYDSVYDSLAGTYAMLRGDYYLQPQRLDLKLAEKYFRAAAQHDCAGAWLALGQLYERNQKIEYAAAGYFAGAFADPACVTALQQLASTEPIVKYYRGRHLERQKNWLAAKELYEEAAAQENPQALFHLGCLLQRTVMINVRHAVIPVNHQQAMVYHARAAKLYYAPALDRLVMLSRVDELAALALANLYSADQQWRAHNLTHALAYFIKSGTIGLQRDFSRAITFVKTQNKPELFYALAEYFVQKRQDTFAALPWFARAAENKHQPAEQELARLIDSGNRYAIRLAAHYESGDHGHQSIVLAIDYWRQVMLAETDAYAKVEKYAKQGNAYAQYVLGAFYFPAKQQFVPAVRWCLRAAQQGYLEAQHYLATTDFPAAALLALADCYLVGDDVVPASPEQAQHYYKRAWDKGVARAAYCLGQFALAAAEPVQQTVSPIAWDYFVAAAQAGYEPALVPLSRLGLIATQQQRNQLAQCYRRFVYTQAEVMYWETPIPVAVQRAIEAPLVTGEPPAALTMTAKLSYS